MTSPTSRIQIIDALRGFAIMAILLIHNMEHFNFYDFPQQVPEVLKSIDDIVWNSLFFLFGGKAYAIFALLFGVSFYIQFNNQAKKGVDFSKRFAWRMFLLFLFGCFHTIFYSGDILMLYAVIGLFLIPSFQWNNRTVMIVAACCLLQPTEWIRFIYALAHPAYVMPDRAFHYYTELLPYFSGKSFTALAYANLTSGFMFTNIWAIENGRIFQTAALFLFGLLLGRKRSFYTTPENRKFWKKMLCTAIVCSILTYLPSQFIPSLLTSESQQQILEMIFKSWFNCSFMLIWVSSFFLLQKYKIVASIQRAFQPYGKMSLTNYISMSIMGTFLFFGYGLGAYRFLGPTFSVMAALVLFTLQLYFCRWWLKHHQYGLLEGIWRKLTWIDLKKSCTDKQVGK